MARIVNDEIVISGVGGIFPQARNIQEFQTRLLSNNNLISNFWRNGVEDVYTAIGKVHSRSLDNAYFKINNPQCAALDPIHLLIFEPTYEALFDAGVNPIELKGKNIGCFIGGWTGEYDNILIEKINSYISTGYVRNMIPNRISYWLDINGPSVYINCNYMSGVEALRQGKEAIENGHCDAAIVGACNLTDAFQIQKIFQEMGLLSPNGTQKPFDFDANGIVRGDALVIFYLQRLSQAKRNYASIINVSSSFYGNSTEALLDKNLNCFTEFLKDFYKNSLIQPHEVDYIETYGSGIKKIDEIEIEGLEKMYCKNRKKSLLIGAVKPNTGHSEASSALVSLVKVLIAMETKTIPATINYTNPNPNITALKNGKIEVVNTNRHWNGKYAAINCFGLTAHYGHILIKSNSKEKIYIIDTIPRLVLAASRTEEGIEEMLHTIESNISDKEYLSLIQDFFSKPTPMLTYRGFLLNSSEANKIESQIYQDNKPKICFVYSGMGSQWNGMVGDLMNISLFAESVNKSHNILVSKGVNLIQVITSKDPQIFNNILHSFIGIAAIQIALTDVLKSLNIIPDRIIGHSVGELGCAYADGCLTAEEMILAAYYRGIACREATLIKGMMAAVELGYNKIKNMLPQNIEVACHNSADSCTISGPAEDIEIFVKQLQSTGIFVQIVNVANIAYHSQYIKPAAPILLNYLKKILKNPIERSSKWISTSIPKDDWDTDLAKYSSAEYHTNNLLSYVYFEEGLKNISNNSILIEIAPHGLLQAILRGSRPRKCFTVALTQRNVSKNVDYFLSALGRLFLNGININLSNLYLKISYPVGKGTASLANLAHWKVQDWPNIYKGVLSSSSNLKAILNSKEFTTCRNNKIKNQYVIPTSIFLDILLKIVTSLQGSFEQIMFGDMTFYQPTIITEKSSFSISAVVFKSTGHFEILKDSTIIVSGKIIFPLANENILVNNENIKNDDNDVINLSENDIYQEFSRRGHVYTDSLKSISNLTLNKEHSIGVVNWNGKWTTLLEAMIQQQLFHDAEQTQESHLPYRINKIAIDFKAVPSEPTKVTIKYNCLSKVISSVGINIIGMQTIPIFNDNSGVRMDLLDFIPFKGHAFDDINGALYFVLGTIIDTYLSNNLRKIEIIEICNPNTKSNNFTQISNLFSNYQINFSKSSSFDNINFKSNVLQLIIANIPFDCNLVKELTLKNMLLLTTLQHKIKNKNVTEMLQFTVNNQSYSLLKRSNNCKHTIFNIKEPKLCNEDFDQNAAWVKKLETSLMLAQKKNLKVYVLFHTAPAEGITNFAKKMFSVQRLKSVFLVFTINSSNTNDILPKIIQNDLKLTIIQNNICGRIFLMPRLFKNFIKNYKIESKNINIAYIGLNNDKVLQSHYKENNVLNINYSGTTKLRESVMGIAQFNKNTSILSLDPILQWKIPPNLHLDEAAAIPLAYACAYYCLVIKGKIKSSSRVLIHSAYSSIGMAALAIASSFECTILITVENTQQKIYLQENFDNIYAVFNSTDHNFQPLLFQATLGKGMDIVLNTLTENLLETSVQCVGLGGKVIHIANNFSDISIGMLIFKEHTSFSVFNPNNLHKLSNVAKNQIKNLIEKGLDNFTNRVIRYKIQDKINIFKFEEDKSTLETSHIIKLHQNNLNSQNFSVGHSKFNCKKDMSYLIIGSKTEDWCDMAEWFISRGAKHLTIALEVKTFPNYVKRLLKLLETTNNANIDIVDNYTSNSLKVIISNLKNRPIDIVCVLPQYINNINFIQNVVYELSPKTLLLHLNTSIIFVPNVINVGVEQELRLKSIYSCLDEVLIYNIKNCVIKANNVLDSDNLADKNIFNYFLPTLSNMLEEYLEAPEEPIVVQLTSLGVKEVREIQPFFVIPGLATQNEVKMMALQLTFPIWMAILPKSQMTINKMAKILIKKMKQVCSGNIYNLIGISWGGVLMTEIAKLLQAENDVILNLYFIDSAPDLIKSLINNLGTNEERINDNILSKICNLNDADQDNLMHLPSFEEKITFIQKYYKTVNLNLLTGVIVHLKHLLKLAKDYHLPGNLINGHIHLIRPNDCNKINSCGLDSYFQQVPKIHFVAGNHLTIVHHKDTTDYLALNHEARLTT